MSTDVIDSNLNADNLIITPEIKRFLSETAKWAKFIAILGFVMLGLMVVFGFAAGGMMASLMSMSDAPSGMPAIGGGFIGAYFLFMFLIAFFPLLFLYKFSSKMKVALAQDDQQFLHESFKNLKSYYKYIGILTIIVLAFYAIGLVFVLIGAAAM